MPYGKDAWFRKHQKMLVSTTSVYRHWRWLRRKGNKSFTYILVGVKVLLVHLRSTGIIKSLSICISHIIGIHQHESRRSNLLRPNPPWATVYHATFTETEAKPIRRVRQVRCEATIAKGHVSERLVGLCQVDETRPCITFIGATKSCIQYLLDMQAAVAGKGKGQSRCLAAASRSCIVCLNAAAPVCLSHHVVTGFPSELKLVRGTRQRPTQASSEWGRTLSQQEIRFPIPDLSHRRSSRLEVGVVTYAAVPSPACRIH